MGGLTRVMRAEAFRILLFCAFIMLFCWPFLPGQDSMDYFFTLKILFGIWGALIVLLLLIGLSLHLENEEQTDGSSG